MLVISNNNNLEKESSFKRARYFYDSSSGATLIQFALALPLFLFMILGFMDLVRIYSVKTILQAGADDGMRVARTITNLDIDTRNLKDGDYDFYRYQWAKDKVMSAAERLPLNSLIGEKGSGVGWAELVPFQHADSGHLSNAALLRPFECAREESGAPNGCKRTDPNCILHPSLEGNVECSDYLGVDSGNLREEPIVLVMRAKVDAILPVFDVEVEGRSTGFRPKIPRADLSLAVLGVVTPPPPPPPPPSSSTTTTTSSSTTSTTEPEVVGSCTPGEQWNCQTMIPPQCATPPACRCQIC